MNRVFEGLAALLVVVGGVWGVFAVKQNIDDKLNNLSTKVAIIEQQNTSRKSDVALKGDVGPRGPQGLKGESGPPGPKGDFGRGDKDSQQQIILLQARVLNLEQQLKGIDTTINMDEKIQQSKALISKSGAVINGDLVYEFDKCKVESLYGWGNSVLCYFKVTNTSKKDVRACLGNIIKIVSDKGNDFDSAESKIGSEKGVGKVCDTIAPLVTVVGWVGMRDTRKYFEENIQFLRVGCGGGCKYEAYKVPIDD